MLSNDLYMRIGDLLLDDLIGKLALDSPREVRFEVAEAILWKITRNESELKGRQLYQDKEKRKQFLDKLFSYDEVEELIRDPNVEDIAINGTKAIFVHTSDRGLVRTEKKFRTSAYLDFFIHKLLVFSGRTNLSKLNDFELPFIEGRVNIVYSPFGPQVTIAKVRKNPLSIMDLIKEGTLDYNLAGFLWMTVEGLKVRPANILIAGSSGSGKTTLLNAMLSFIPARERIVVIEDILELNTLLMDNFSRLESDNDLSYESLVKNTLRMRPERIIVGEVRGKEAQDMMTVMNVGKYCISTLHATNTKEAFSRLENVPMNVSPPLINLIDIFVVLRKHQVDEDRYRRIVSELCETSSLVQKRPLLSVLWKYNYKDCKVDQVGSSSSFREKLATSSGKKNVDILNEWKMRKKFLYFMEKKGITDFEEVTEVCKLYSKNRDEALKKVGTSVSALDNLTVPD